MSAHFGDGGSGEGARLADGVLTILAEGGFSSDAAVVCFATIFTFMTGQIDLTNVHSWHTALQVATLENVTQHSRSHVKNSSSSDTTPSWKA